MNKKKENMLDNKIEIEKIDNEILELENKLKTQGGKRRTKRSNKRNTKMKRKRRPVRGE